MDRVIDVELTAIVQREIEDYARGKTFLGQRYPVSDLARQTYAVLVIPDHPPKFEASIVMFARIVGDNVVIDEDTTDRPLWQELVRAGIPRTQIILAYAGEKLLE